MHTGRTVRGKISREADLFRPESKEGNQPGGCTLVVEG